MSSSEINERRWDPGRQGATVNLIVVHTTEGGYGITSAENLKAWMAGDSSSSAYHYAYDMDSEVDLVSEGDTAWGAGGVNYRSLHLCVCGKAASIPWVEFLDTPGGKLFILRAARLAINYQIPANKLNGLEVKNGVWGICGHADVSEYHRASNGHSDPGVNFPWEDFINRVRYIILLSTAPPPLPPNPSPAEGPVIYKVVAGDYLTLIAQKCYQVTAWAERQRIATAIGNANGVTDQQLKPGMFLTLPGKMVL